MAYRFDDPTTRRGSGRFAPTGRFDPTRPAPTSLTPTSLTPTNLTPAHPTAPTGQTGMALYQGLNGNQGTHSRRKTDTGVGGANPPDAAGSTGFGTAPRKPYLSRLEENLDRYHQGNRTAGTASGGGDNPGGKVSISGGSGGRARPPATASSLGAVHSGTTALSRGGTIPAQPPIQSTAPSFVGDPTDDHRTVDQVITDLMRDRQYWQNGRTADAYRDGIAQLWKLAYPGKYVEGSFSRNVEPATSPDNIRTAAATLLGQPPSPQSDHPTGPTPGNGPDTTKQGAATALRNAPAPQQASAGTAAASALHASATSPQSPGIGHNSALALSEEKSGRNTAQDTAAETPAVQLAQFSRNVQNSEAWHRQQELDRKWKETGNPDVTPGKTIAENHDNYGRMDEALNSIEGAIQSDWFKAAHEVTSWNAVGSSDDSMKRLNFDVLTDQDDDYLKYVHHKLAPINIENYQHLVKGQEIPGLEGLRGKELDYALVKLEQENVSRLTEEYFKLHPELNRKEILYSVSRASDPDSIQGQMREFAANGAVRNAMEREFGTGDYDADNEAHRIRLGVAIIDAIRDERNRND